MSKPDDIPEEVWFSAQAVVGYDAGCDCDHCCQTHGLIEPVARAILAERERCAKVCDAFIQAYDEEIASLGLVQPRRGSPAKYAVKCIASDIREGSNA